MAQQASSGEAVGEITDIQVRDNMVEIKVSRHFTYTLYSTDDPYKIAVDIPAKLLWENSTEESYRRNRELLRYFPLRRDLLR